MTDIKPKTPRAGIGWLGVGAIFTTLFLILKLTGVVTFSWLWVFAPLIFAAGISIAILFLGVIVIAIAAAAIAKSKE